MTPEDRATQAIRVMGGAVAACQNALDRHLERTGHKAGWLLVGWEVWLAMGREMGRVIPPQSGHMDFAGRMGPQEMNGIPIVVDEWEAHSIRALPQLSHVRPRTRPSTLET